MSDLQRIVLASSNKGKIREFQALFANLPYDVIPQTELNVTDADETGLTFIENAILKARHACAITKLPAIADDSGVCVDALGGAPGIYSARYAGPNATGTDRINKMLDEMKTVPDGSRTAAFHSVIAFLQHEKDPDPIITHGIWPGRILHEPKGNQGFGYDPIFFLEEQQCTAAELEPTLKNKISHRGQAMEQLLSMLG